MLAKQNSKTMKYQLEQILKAGNVGTWVWNIRDKTISGDRNMASLFGLDPARQREQRLRQEFRFVETRNLNDQLGH